MRNPVPDQILTGRSSRAKTIRLLYTTDAADRDGAADTTDAADTAETSDAADTADAADRDGEDAMSDNDDWSPDEPLGTEAFEQGDEALDEDSRIDSSFIEDVEKDPSLDPTLQADERELEEIGAELDDPEDLVTLDGGMDDPDGLGGPTQRALSRRKDQDGWDLDAPEAGDTEVDDTEADDTEADAEFD